MEPLVWYVSYGSNLRLARFAVYIKGGSFEGAGPYAGAKNKTMPSRNEPFSIPFSIFFMKRSITWGGGGVAFLDVSKLGFAYGRAYLITKEQFDDVRRQEGSDYYPDEINLGLYKGYPAMTFTDKHKQKNMFPSEAYLNVIKSGIRETYPQLTEEAISSYMDDAVDFK